MEHPAIRHAFRVPDAKRETEAMPRRCCRDGLCDPVFCYHESFRQRQTGHCFLFVVVFHIENRLAHDDFLVF
jgi:hypothetical protein